MDAYTKRAAAGAMDGDHQSASKWTEEAEAAPQAEAGWKVESVSARKTENGGIIVTCSKTRELAGKERERMGSRDYQSKDYAFSSIDEALGYIAQELGGATSGSSGSGVMAAPQGAIG